MKNVSIAELKEVIDRFGKAWTALPRYGSDPRVKKFRYKVFPAVGWIKSIEIFYGTGGITHPHLHISAIYQDVPSSTVGLEYWTMLA